MSSSLSLLSCLAAAAETSLCIVLAEDTSLLSSGMVVLWDTLEMVIHPRKDRSSLVHRVVFCCILRRGGCGGDSNDAI